MALYRRIKSAFEDDEPEAQGPLEVDAPSVGEVLQRERLSLRLELGDVAAALKIKPDYLAAIEQGEPQQLPGPAYALGFVRSYSDYLALDSAELVRRFKLETSVLAAKPDLTFPIPLEERSLPTGSLVLAGLILAVCSYGAWYHFSMSPKALPERVSEVPAELTRSGLTGGVLAGRPQQQSLPERVSRPDLKPARRPELDPGSSRQRTIDEGLGPSGSRPPISAPDDSAGSGPSVSPTTGASIANTPSAGVGDAPRASAPSSAPMPGIHPAAAADPAVPVSQVPTATTRARSGATVTNATPPPGGIPVLAATATDGVGGSPSSPSTVASAKVSANTEPNAATGASRSANQNRAGARVYGASDQTTRIAVRATADSWVQVRAADRSILFTGFLKPGDTYLVPDRPGLTMRAGNAGGLDIAVDGKPAPAIGPIGAVRNVSLDPGSLVGRPSRHD